MFEGVYNCVRFHIFLISQNGKLINAVKAQALVTMSTFVKNFHEEQNIQKLRKRLEEFKGLFKEIEKIHYNIEDIEPRSATVKQLTKFEDTFMIF